MKQIIVTTHEELRELFHESIQKFKEGLEAEPQHQAPSDPIFTMDEATKFEFRFKTPVGRTMLRYRLILRQL